MTRTETIAAICARLPHLAGRHLLLYGRPVEEATDVQLAEGLVWAVREQARRERMEGLNTEMAALFGRARRVDTVLPFDNTGATLSIGGLNEPEETP